MTHAALQHIGDDRCLDLVQDLLDSSARQAALEHLRACDPCERRFQEVAASHARALSASRSLLRPHAAGAVVPLAPRVRARPWMLVAASIVLLLGAATVVRRISPDRVALTGLESRLPAARLRSAVRGLGAADSTVAAGLDAYNRGDFAVARRLLETARAGASMENVRRIYLGSALLELGDATQACAVLRGIDEKLVPEPWKSETQWTLALALAHSGRHATADSILAVLARGKGPAAERARELRGR